MYVSLITEKGATANKPEISFRECVKEEYLVIILILFLHKTGCNE